MLDMRDPQALVDKVHDLIVVGGGIYGIMVALEATRRGLRPLLVDRGEFGAATSANSLRIVHGGFRYLQTLDLRRFMESMAERRWFLRHFPDLVHPLPCLMPLFGDGVRRPAVLRLALICNDLLYPGVNAGVRADRTLPRGRVLTPEQALSACPGLAREGLRGAALWHDGFIQDTPRLLIDALHWACARGAWALDHVVAEGTLTEAGRVAGIHATDTVSGQNLQFRAPLVINAAGPWAAEFAAASGARADGIFTPALAWNVAFDRPPPAECALAVRSNRAGAQTYILVPWNGMLLAGTGHAPWPHGIEEPSVPEDQLGAFIDELNAALPSLGLERRQVAQVFPGLLPTERPGVATLTTREVIVDHGAHGGPRGLYTICGIKLTTARSVADKALSRALPDRRAIPYGGFQRPLEVNGTPQS